MADAHATAGKYYVPHESRWPIIGSAAFFTLLLGVVALLNEWFGGQSAWAMVPGFALVVYMFIGWFSTVIDENQSGVALAMAIQNPDLVGSERFGVATNWGNFEGANALGLSLMGVLGNNLIALNDRVAVSGGFGVGFDYGSGDNVYGGRVGLQWTR